MLFWGRKLGFSIEITPTFDKAFSKVPEDIKKRVIVCLQKLKEGETSGVRLHRLRGLNPPVYKFDVLPNKSWQVACERKGDTIKLLTIGTHKFMDRSY